MQADPTVNREPHGEPAAYCGQILSPPEAISKTETSTGLKPSLWIRLHFAEMFYLQPSKSLWTLANEQQNAKKNPTADIGDNHIHVFI